MGVPRLKCGDCNKKFRADHNIYQSVVGHYKAKHKSLFIVYGLTNNTAHTTMGFYKWIVEHRKLYNV